MEIPMKNMALSNGKVILEAIRWEIERSATISIRPYKDAGNVLSPTNDLTKWTQHICHFRLLQVWSSYRFPCSFHISHYVRCMKHVMNTKMNSLCLLFELPFQEPHEMMSPSTSSYMTVYIDVRYNWFHVKLLSNLILSIYIEMQRSKRSKFRFQACYIVEYANSEESLACVDQ